MLKRNNRQTGQQQVVVDRPCSSVDERFPLTMAAVRQLLRRFGLEDNTAGPLP